MSYLILKLHIIESKWLLFFFDNHVYETKASKVKSKEMNKLMLITVISILFVCNIIRSERVFLTAQNYSKWHGNHQIEQIMVRHC